MKKITLFIICLSISFISFAQTSNKDKWLNENSHKIAINSNNKDFTDMEFLKKEIANQQIIAIGEQTHGDGNTFEARNRLIQFLVKEMDFEVILFEAGMFDVNYGNTLYQQTNQTKYLRNSLYSFWKDSKQHESLFNFFEQEKNLEFGGFDSKFSSPYKSKFISELDSVLNIYEKDISENSIYIKYRKIWNRISKAQGLEGVMPKMTEEELKVFENGSMWVQQILNKAKHPLVQVIKNYDKNILMYANLSMQDPEFQQKMININNQRDVLMAENLNYLLENVYKGKKVILFGATYHFIRNNQNIEVVDAFPLPIEKSIIMGDLIQSKYQKKIYTIGFTAYEGSYGMATENSSDRIQKIQPAKEGSLEKRLVDKGFDNGILLLNTPQKKPDWWYQSPTIRLFTYNSATACKDWSKVLDAVFFIRKMEPVLLVKE